MKRTCVLSIGILLLFAVTMNSCSNDEKDFDYKDIIFEDNPTSLNGTWHLMKASYGWGGTREYDPGEITIAINESKSKITVKTDTNQELYFLKDGTYQYTTSTTRYRFYTYQWVEEDVPIIIIDVKDGFHKSGVEYTYSIKNGYLLFDACASADGYAYYFIKQLSNNR